MVPASSIIKRESFPDSTAASSVSPPAVTQQFVRELAREAGFTEAGIVGLPHPQSERDAKRFTEFIDQGRAGNMAYLARRDEKNELLRSRIDLPFPWARSVVVCMAGYHAAAPLSTAAAKAGTGWIARYAWSGKTNEKGETRPSDYHKVLLKRLRSLEERMHATFGDFESRAFVDTGPIVERAAARAAGLGWTGKNTCLIHPKAGSWNFLAVLVTSLEVPAEATPLAVPDRCGSCRRCLDACPTQALIEPYQMDATRCIAYLTIEHHGEIAESLRPGMGRQIFGCDICQDVCPWNRKAPIGRDDAELHPREELINPDLGWLADLELADYERIFNGSPVRRAGFWGLRRNIAIAMGNSGLRRFVPWLERWAEAGAETGAETGVDGGPDTLSREDLDRAAARDSARWALARFAGAGAEPERGSESFRAK